MSSVGGPLSQAELDLRGVKNTGSFRKMHLLVFLEFFESSFEKIMLGLGASLGSKPVSIAVTTEGFGKNRVLAKTFAEEG